MKHTNNSIQKLVQKYNKTKKSSTRTLYQKQIESADVSEVTNMACLFNNSPFNGDLNNWNTEMVETMFELFKNSKYNHPLNKWNVSKVKIMRGAFINSDFDQNIGTWILNENVIADDALITKISKDRLALLKSEEMTRLT